MRPLQRAAREETRRHRRKIQFYCTKYIYLSLLFHGMKRVLSVCWTRLWFRSLLMSCVWCWFQTGASKLSILAEDLRGLCKSHTTYHNISSLFPSPCLYIAVALSSNHTQKLSVDRWLFTQRMIDRTTNRLMLVLVLRLFNCYTMERMKLHKKKVY